MADKDNKFMRELIEHHVSGQLKVAPEHISEEVLQYMQKPAGDTYDRFRQKFFDITEQLGKKQYIIPYLMSSHPGSTLNSAIELAEYLRDIKYQPEQVQDFYPTPGTLSTTMFYTGLDPLTMKPVYIPKSKHEKAMQRALLQYSAPRNYDLVYQALVEAGREDLIGMAPRCLNNLLLLLVLLNILVPYLLNLLFQLQLKLGELNHSFLVHYIVIMLFALLFLA